MAINEELSACLGKSLGSAIESTEPVSGGDLSDAYRIRLHDGELLFLKTMSDADPALFPAEAEGLDWLRAGTSLKVPEVLAVSSEFEEGPKYLALEWIESAPKAADFDLVLGEGLAELHAAGASCFGLELVRDGGLNESGPNAIVGLAAATELDPKPVGRDNFLGPLRQDNSPAGSWAQFYRERRLHPWWRQARDAGLTSQSFDRGMEKLLSELELYLGPPEPPARLHGDLWTGNVMTTASGRPALIDPAVYGGHREVDLAMLKLFGGQAAAVMTAYESCTPLAPEAGPRVPLFQLMPLLAHLNLFGTSYLGACESALQDTLSP